MADAGPRLATVEYSGDGGRSWRAVANGPDDGSARVPSALLAASRRARVRVRVNDGFNEGSGRSGRFRAAGRPPAVTITSPRRGARVVSDGTLYLAGEAWADTGRRLTGRRLTWFDGRRVIGRGAQVAESGLRAGGAGSG